MTMKSHALTVRLDGCTSIGNATQSDVPTITGFKFVTQELKSFEGNVQWVPGEWQRFAGSLQKMLSGFHAHETAFRSFEHSIGAGRYRLFFVEAKWQFVLENGVIVASEMRLTEINAQRIAPLFAARCARDALGYVEISFPEDKMSRRGHRGGGSVLCVPE